MFGLGIDVDALESQVCDPENDALEECTDADEDDARCVYVDHGQCGRDRGDGRPGELDIGRVRGDPCLRCSAIMGQRRTVFVNAVYGGSEQRCGISASGWNHALDARARHVDRLSKVQINIIRGSEQAKERVFK